MCNCTGRAGTHYDGVSPSCMTPARLRGVSDYDLCVVTERFHLPVVFYLIPYLPRHRPSRGYATLLCAPYCLFVVFWWWGRDTLYLPRPGAC